MEGSAKTLDKPLLEGIAWHCTALENQSNSLSTDDEGVLSFTPPRPDGDEKDNEEALAAPQSSKQLVRACVGDDVRY